MPVISEGGLHVAAASQFRQLYEPTDRIIAKPDSSACLSLHLQTQYLRTCVLKTLPKVNQDLHKKQLAVPVVREEGFNVAAASQFEKPYYEPTDQIVACCRK